MLKEVYELLKVADNERVSKLFKLEKVLKEDIRKETALSSGSKSSDLTIIKRITKNGKTDKRWEQYHEFELNGKVYYGFLEGHRILASADTFGYEKANSNNTLPLAKMFDTENKIEYKVDLLDLKVWTKQQDKKNIKPYVIETPEIKIGVNAQFLQDSLQFCNTDTIYINGVVAPIYIEQLDKEKISIVLPVKLV